MKTFIKYISLLLFCGLIASPNPCLRQAGCPPKESFRINERTLSAAVNIVGHDTKAATSIGRDGVKGALNGFSILKDIAVELFPVLKNLN